MNSQKITFRLDKDIHGYPPDDWETLWTNEVEEGVYSIDNIPFYVKEISPADLVTALTKGGRLYFNGIVQKSDKSVVRVIIYDESKVLNVRADLRTMGCESEQSHIPNLIAVEVPADVVLDSVLAFLD